MIFLIYNFILHLVLKFLLKVFWLTVWISLISIIIFQQNFLHYLFYFDLLKKYLKNFLIDLKLHKDLFCFQKAIISIVILKDSFDYQWLIFFISFLFTFTNITLTINIILLHILTYKIKVVILAFSIKFLFTLLKPPYMFISFIVDESSFLVCFHLVLKKKDLVEI